ncbi:T9SS type B sorting domain-containing protein [Empedobacter falsenii]|uniref:T9SS type B sorting domain-containing protein n=1 Tax=Empedobacter falsenii TaxID=343874 RepID=UPI00257770EE|nr:T9SS type B sorting domain-containing protein [Empedobacter falsenii]MDM1061965.1 T9SS type B sorting domain-containing protein [Empedobacter falsenii]
MNFNLLSKLILACIFLGFYASGQNLTEAKFKYLCSNQTVTGESPQATNYFNLRTNCATSALSPKIDFYLIRIKSGTKFTFTLTPEKNIDYDFVSWLNPNLENVGLGDRGSSNNPHNLNIYSVGLDLNTSIVCDPSGAASDGKVRYYDVRPGDVILIALDRWEDVESGYSISFGGDAILDCTFNGNNFSSCEDNDAGHFDMNNIKQTISLKYPSNYSIKIYESKNDAIEGNSKEFTNSQLILQKSNSPKTMYALILDQENIMAKIEEFSLTVTEKLNFTPQNIIYCDALTITPINLKNAIPTNILSNTNFKIKFFESKNDAENNTNEISNPEQYRGEVQTIYCRTENKLDEECYTLQSFQLINNQKQIVELGKINFCQDQQNPTKTNLSKILTENQTLRNYNLKYYRTQLDFENNTNEISDINNFEYTNNDGVIYIKAFSPNDICPNLYKIEYTVNEFSKLVIENKIVKCAEDSFVLDLSNYSEEIELIGEHQNIQKNIFKIEKAVQYKINVKNEFGCMSVYNFEVQFYNAPIIENVILSDNKLKFDTSTISTSTLFSIDKVNWQNDKEFTLPKLGIPYTIYAKYNECIFELYTFNTYVINNFISPNNDGHNDTWTVNIDQNIISYSVLIYDRFGKTIKQIKSPGSILWDGKLNGQRLPSDSYWYQILTNDDHNDEVIKMKYTGYITLKNK